MVVVAVTALGDKNQVKCVKANLLEYLFIRTTERRRPDGPRTRSQVP